jgi:hypothetical protein
MTAHPRYRCPLCGAVLPAWWPVAQEPNGAMLLHHLSFQHPDQVKAYLDRMHRDEDIGTMAAEAYEMVEEDKTR